ncbi:MAG TPA: DNA polymerase III subunit gamma/tau [Blastocatellia bacterium]|nr:DNA polymerase III subunit gamma/tau [Blastocatellia bacterium]
MSYQVIARKYRPQTFADLTGQEHISRTLGNALDNQRLHHAYLFTGVRGTGKTTTARILAKGLNCHTGVTSRPCLQCPSCVEIAAGNSLDVLEIDAASNTGVDNVREVIINNIAMAPARDRYKVFVIDEVHMLSSSAFNSLLKTLEEPPSHVVFIMATTELHKVPDTILSRCQQFEFRQIPTEKIFQRLREIAAGEGIKISDAALREVARAGAGSLRDAQSAFDQVIAFSGNQIAEDDVTTALGLVSAATLGRFIEAIADRNTTEILNLVEEVFVRGYDLRNFTRELTACLRHLLVIKSGISGSDLLGVTDVEVDRLKQLSSRFSEEDLVRLFHLLAETEKEIKDSPHPRFQLEIGLVKLTHATRLKSLDEMIKRLEELESRITGGAAGGAANQPAAKGPATKNQAPVSNIKSGQSGQSTISAPTVAEEPPDDQYFDLTEPDDLYDSLPVPPPRQSTTREVQTQAQTQAQIQSGPASITPGREVEAILKELQKMNKPLVLHTLDDAQGMEFRDGALTVTLGNDDIFAKRLRESGQIFRDIGARILGRPINLVVKISGHVEERIDEAELKRRSERERAMQNPAVRLIIEKTRAEMLSVKSKDVL